MTCAVYCTIETSAFSAGQRSPEEKAFCTHAQIHMSRRRRKKTTIEVSRCSERSVTQRLLCHPLRDNRRCVTFPKRIIDDLCVTRSVMTTVRDVSDETSSGCEDDYGTRKALLFLCKQLNYCSLFPKLKTVQKGNRVSDSCRQYTSVRARLARSLISG